MNRGSVLTKDDVAVKICELVSHVKMGQPHEQQIEKKRDVRNVCACAEKKIGVGRLK